MEELERQRRDLEVATQRALDAETVRSLYPVLQERLERASDEDKYFVLQCLGSRVVLDRGSITLELAIPEHNERTVGSIPGGRERNWGGYSQTPTPSAGSGQTTVTYARRYGTYLQRGSGNDSVQHRRPQGPMYAIRRR